MATQDLLSYALEDYHRSVCCLPFCSSCSSGTCCWKNEGTGLQFADGCTILMYNPTSAELQHTIASNCSFLNSWMQKWKLQINCSKTEIVVFNGKINSPTIGTEKIKICDSSKSLGVIVDKKLSFAYHLATVPEP